MKPCNPAKYTSDPNRGTADMHPVGAGARWRGCQESQAPQGAEDGLATHIEREPVHCLTLRGKHASSSKSYKEQVPLGRSIWTVTEKKTLSSIWSRVSWIRCIRGTPGVASDPSIDSCTLGKSKWSTSSTASMRWQRCWNLT